MEVYKIVPASEWAAAVERGTFEGAPVDRADGFIHLSTAAQVAGTLAKHFAGQRDLVLVSIEASRLGDALRWEASRGGRLFPHLHGSMNPSVVTSVRPIALDGSGTHVVEGLVTAPHGDLRRAYDRVAPRYAEQFSDELAHKPLDRALLALFADSVARPGLVADIGCGPGHIAAHLHAKGLAVRGIDLSEEMIAHARRTVPGVDFQVGDLLALDEDADAFAGIVAFYAIVHLEPVEVIRAAHELFRVLRPGGALLLSFHEGTDRIRLRDWFGHAVDVEWVFFPIELVVRALERAGFAIDARIQRAPYVPFEHPSTRAYVLAHRPAAAE